MKRQMNKLFLAALLSFGFTAHATEAAEGETVKVQVTKKGFEPSSIQVPAGKPITLEVTRTTKSTCAKKISVPSQDIKKDLPLNVPVKISLGKLEKGEVKFGCGMNMMLGAVIRAE